MFNAPDLKDIFIGALIRQKVDESGMTYAEFAHRIHTSRTNVYRIFESKSVDTERLIIISSVLDYDFIHEVYFAEKPYFNPNQLKGVYEELKMLLQEQENAT